MKLVDMGFLSTWCYPDMKWKQVYTYFMSEEINEFKNNKKDII